jgi:hypothetical protein
VGTRSIGLKLSALLITIGFFLLVLIITQDENIVRLINPVYEDGKVTMFLCIDDAQKCRDESEVYLFSDGERCVLHCVERSWRSREISHKFVYRSGYYCVILENSIPAYQSGSSLGIHFHKIDCDGTIGFVDRDYIKLNRTPFPAER